MAGKIAAIAGAAGNVFFSAGTGRYQPEQLSTRPGNWTAFRDRWELSHVIRAALGGLSLVALVIAIS